MNASIPSIARGLDRFSPLMWLALVAAALWPNFVWMARRAADGSDDPLGIAALAMLVLLVWRERRSLARCPKPAWFAASLGFVAVASVSWRALPSLVSALVGIVGFSMALLAFLPRSVARIPVLGLSVLSLPLLASLQFYAGFPLRVLTAELSRWLLLTAHHQVARDGVALLIDGQLVLVDAPCSGVQLVWLGYFTACATALLLKMPDARFVRRLPAVSASILAGNVVRNALLVHLQADGGAVAGWLHQGIGLMVLAAVLLLIFWAVRAAAAPRTEIGSHR